MISPRTLLLGSMALLVVWPISAAGESFEAQLHRTVHVSAALPNGGATKTGVMSAKGLDVIFSSKGTDYTLANGGQIFNAVKEKDFPLHLETSKPKGAGEHYLKITQFGAKSVGQWKEAIKGIVPENEQPVLKNVNENVSALASKTKENITEVAANQDWKGVLAQYRATRESIAQAYGDVEDAPTRAELARLKGNLATEERNFLLNKLTDQATAAQADSYVESLSAVEKRYYRLNDNYRPEIYPMISERSASCVALVRKTGGSWPIGSGVIIGDDMVLTCKHNIPQNGAKTFQESEYLVWIDFEERRFGGQLSNTVCECEETYRSDALDFVLLRIRRADNKQRLGRPAIALNGNRVMRWTPIFLVGYPQGNRRTIHDSSWILFPHHLLNNAEWGEIESSVTQEYQEGQSSQDPNVRAQRAAEQARDFMTTRYGAFDPGGQKEYVLQRDGAEYIGAECDTFEGDSGAPAMLREGGSLIGILFKGGSDFGASASTDIRNPAVSSRPGAQFHERILPISKIIADLDARYPQWRNLGVKVE